jgi:hypothetical protein
VKRSLKPPEPGDVKSVEKRFKVAIEAIGITSVHVIQLLLESALEKATAGRELTKAEIDSVWKVQGMNPGFLRSQGFRDKAGKRKDDDEGTEEEKARDVENLSTTELLRLEREHAT